MSPLGGSKCPPPCPISGVRGGQNVPPPKMPVMPDSTRDRVIRQKVNIGLLEGVKMSPLLDI